MKAIEQCFHLLFIMLFKVVVYYAVQGGAIF